MLQLIPADDDAHTDEAILIQAARNNPAAFGLLYRRYRHRVYGYLRVRLADEDDAADVTQQTFLYALAALSQYRGQSSTFSSWLFRIARNTAVDFQRRMRPTIDWDRLPEAKQPATSQDLESETLRREDVTSLRTLLATLDAEIQELLALRFAARLTAAEIGIVLGKSEAATSKWLWRTMQMLKERYSDATR